MRERVGNWMQTFTGLQFWPLDPSPDEISIFDIAHALSHICRFGAHCHCFYSVAEHSILVSQVVPPEDALVGLLHDAPEAYLGDVITPLKKHIPNYKMIEDAVWRAVRTKFSLPEIPPSVKDADLSVLIAEKNAIMGPSPAPWTISAKPAKVDILCYSPSIVESRFLARFFKILESSGSVLSESSLMAKH